VSNVADGPARRVSFHEIPTGSGHSQREQASTSIPARSPGYEQVRLVDINGQEIHPLAGTDALAVVFVFTRSDCPISNSYAPELQRLYHKFGSLDVTFWLVYVDPRESASAIRHHVSEYGYPFGALRDPKHELVRLTGAQVTPEVVVFVSRAGRQEMIYRGRIDDRYVDFGQERTEPTTHDLEHILTAIAGAEPVKSETTRAVGCFISDLEH